MTEKEREKNKKTLKKLSSSTKSHAMRWVTWLMSSFNIQNEEYNCRHSQMSNTVISFDAAYNEINVCVRHQAYTFVSFVIVIMYLCNLRNTFTVSLWKYWRFLIENSKTESNKIRKNFLLDSIFFSKKSSNLEKMFEIKQKKLLRSRDSL